MEIRSHASTYSIWVLILVLQKNITMTEIWMPQKIDTVLSYLENITNLKNRQIILEYYKYLV